MSRYAREDMYEVPEPVFGHKRRYGGSEPAKKKSKTASSLISKKGSSRASGTHSSQFRFASVYNALRDIAKGLGGVGKDKEISWSKAAVQMIASAVEYKLRKLLVDATSFTSFTGKKTVSLAAVSHAAEVNGIPLNVTIGHAQERELASQITGELKQQQREGLRDPQAKAKRTRKINLVVRKRVSDARTADFDTSSQQVPGFAKVSVAVSIASIKNMLKLAGAERSSSKSIHIILTSIAHGFMTNIVRNIISVLKLNGNVRVSEHITRAVLQGLGINSAGFSGAEKVVRQKRVAKAAEEIAAAANAALGRGPAPAAVAAAAEAWAQ